MGHMRKAVADDVGHGQERTALLTESQVGHLVGGVHYAGCVAALPDGFVGHAQTAELLFVGLLKGEVLHLPPVETGEVAGQTLGVRECQLDGYPHVGCAQLCLHGSVGKLHRTVHYALRVHHYLYLMRVNVEEPLGLYYFEALVHHARRVYRYLGSHVPVGMLERHSGRHRFELCAGEGAEGASAGCQDNLLDGTHLAHQALEDGTVLAVNGQYRHFLLEAKPCHQFACHYERLFVGQRNGLVCLYRADGRAQTAESYECRKHDIYGTHLHHLAQRLASCIYLNRLLVQSQAHLLILAFVCDDHCSGLVFACLFDEQVGAAVCCQHVSLEEVGMLVDDL